MLVPARHSIVIGSSIALYCRIGCCSGLPHRLQFSHFLNAIKLIFLKSRSKLYKRLLSRNAELMETSCLHLHLIQCRHFLPQRYRQQTLMPFRTMQMRAHCPSGIKCESTDYPHGSSPSASTIRSSRGV